MNLRAILPVLLCAAVWIATARAEPVPESERIPVDLRRTTLLVRDIDRSLPVYRDALGLKVIYDEKIGGGTDADGKPKPPSIRLVLLRANDTFIGVLGLMQRLGVEHPPQRERRKAQAGEVILVFNAKDLEERFPKLRAIPGVQIETEPERVEYPAPGGKGTIPVLFSAFWDPDGYYVELNKILGAPAGTARQ
jgi:catechol 2,3-dioxygenase-like lactoylglutathione lyase family enzyme